MRKVILGCPIDNLSMAETLQKIEEFVRSGEPHQHVVVNVDKIVKAHRDPALMKIIGDCDLINVDGMPVVWVSRLLGNGLKERVAGIDLFVQLIAQAAQRGWRVYFLGAREEVVAHLCETLLHQHPALNIVGFRHGYWQDDEEAGVAEAIRAVQPDLLFVAISSPKKERFLGKYQRYMQVPFAMGVGGTFDVVTGLTRRAPPWMQRAGLEWFFRFLQEPRRMFRRYFIEDMYFFWLVVKHLMYGKVSRRRRES